MNLYLDRYAYPEQLIYTPPHENLGIVVTIPSYNEEEALTSLVSLYNAKRPRCSTEILVLINIPEAANEEIVEKNLHQYNILSSFAKANNTDLFKIFVFFKKLPVKHAGVGLARKIVMDEAVRRLDVSGNPKGIITGFDADCLCDANYFIAIENFFEKNTYNGCSIFFEHPKNGNFEQEVITAALEYELHLRVYINGLRWCGLPHAFQTIGSSMAIRSDAYQRQGGMNKRKAGEDFYFLHRIIREGQFGDLTSTTVSPSPRISERVPFGTGKAVLKRLESGIQLTYNPNCYSILKKFLITLPELYKGGLNQLESQPPLLKEFLVQNDFEKNIIRIKKQSSTYSLFQKHFFQWFDGFKTMKFLHFCRDNGFQSIEVYNASHKVKELLTGDPIIEDPLAWYRNFDKNNPSLIRLE